MATVRNPSSLAARNIRMAISLRLAASSLRIGLVFFISESINGSPEILHCFMVTTRLSSSFFDLENQLFLGAERRRPAGCMPPYGLVRPSGTARCAEFVGLDATSADLNCCSWVCTLAQALALRFVAYGASGAAKHRSSSAFTSDMSRSDLFYSRLVTN